MKKRRFIDSCFIYLCKISDFYASASKISLILFSMSRGLIEQLGLCVKSSHSPPPCNEIRPRNSSGGGDGCPRAGFMCGCRDRMVAISESYRGRMGLSATLLTFLLFAEHSLLLALSFFEASHEARFLFRLFGGFCHLCAHLVFGDKFAEDIGLDDSDEE